MKKKVKTLDEKALLKKNPKAAKVLEQNRAKMAHRPARAPKGYDIGIPFSRPALVSLVDTDNEAELCA